MSVIQLKLCLLKETYAVCQLSPSSIIGDWATQGDFFSITKTKDETSVVCLQDKVPYDVKAEKNWRVLKIEGPFAFTQIGILNAVTSTLAANGISLFALSTFDTDYILIKADDLDSAKQCLRQAGHQITFD